MKTVSVKIRIIHKMRILIFLSVLFLSSCKSTNTKETNEESKKTSVDTNLIIKTISFADSVDKTNLINAHTFSNTEHLDTLLLEYDGASWDGYKWWLDSKKLEYFKQHSNPKNLDFQGFADSFAYKIKPASKDLIIKDELMWSGNKFIFVGKKTGRKEFAENCADSSSLNTLGFNVFLYFSYKVIRPYYITGVKTKRVNEKGDTMEYIHPVLIK